MDSEKVVFIDGVDWQHEVGEASDGNKIYPSVEDLMKYEKCAKSCGVVKVAIRELEWVVPPDDDKTETITFHEMEQLDHRMKQVVRLVNMLTEAVRKFTPEEFGQLHLSDEVWQNHLYWARHGLCERVQLVKDDVGR